MINKLVNKLINFYRFKIANFNKEIEYRQKYGVFYILFIWSYQVMKTILLHAWFNQKYRNISPYRKRRKKSGKIR